MTSRAMHAMLFAGLAMILIVPTFGINSVHAVQPSQTDAETITQETQKIEAFKQKALNDGNIPDTELLKRHDSAWISQYKSVQEFEKYENGIDDYVNTSHQNNGWNQDVVKSQIKIHNFEIMIGKVGYGHEITLLVAEKNKLQGNYNPPEPVKKYHDWIAKQYSVPDTIQGIDDRLVSIVGDKKFIPLAEKVAEEFDNLAKHGSVPMDLFNSDVNYWVFTADVAGCEYNSACNVTAMTAAQNAPKESVVQPKPVSGFWQYILPEAFAWTQQYVSYNLFTYINLSSCYYASCYESWQDAGITGPATIDIPDYTRPTNNIQHAYTGATMTFYGSACPNVSSPPTPISEVNTTPYLAMSLDTTHTTDTVNYPYCATTSSSFTATHDWIVGIKTTSPGTYVWVQ